MANSYFSPNKSITGGALFLSFNSKDGNVYAKFLKQIANNPDKKNNFDGKNPINIKLNQDEAAGIIRAVRTNSSHSLYHEFNSEVTTGSFKYYKIEAKEGSPERQGFGFTIKKNEKEIKVGFTLASAERLSLFLQNALVHIFDAEYAQDIKDAKEYAEKAKKTQKTEDAPTPAPSPEPTQSDDNVDF